VSEVEMSQDINYTSFSQLQYK